MTVQECRTRIPCVAGCVSAAIAVNRIAVSATRRAQSRRDFDSSSVRSRLRRSLHAQWYLDETILWRTDLSPGLVNVRCVAHGNRELAVIAAFDLQLTKRL